MLALSSLTGEETPEPSEHGGGERGVRGGMLWIYSRAPNSSACEVYAAEELG